jgi:hypothetical protein
MKVKDLRTFPSFKKYMEKIMSGECDDYEVIVQLNSIPAPMTFVNVDDRFKTVWLAGRLEDDIFKKLVTDVSVHKF